jgi:hypothetical protein
MAKDIPASSRKFYVRSLGIATHSSSRAVYVAVIIRHPSALPAERINIYTISDSWLSSANFIA